MSDENQVVVPASFVALYLPPGRTRPTAARAEIAARYEFCEDLATMLTETAADKQWQLGADGSIVIDRMHRGLLDAGSPVSPAEARWVVTRLAELLGWPAPVDEADGADAADAAARPPPPAGRQRTDR